VVLELQASQQTVALMAVVQLGQALTMKDLVVAPVTFA
jgi:hypothetical protein